jgi:hypothetical protein
MDAVTEKIITRTRGHIINIAAKFFGNLSEEMRIFIRHLYGNIDWNKLVKFNSEGK